ncbi:MAG: hypothetical protein LBD10_05345 [Desulfobulbus sp.]|jgi:hypothetical protein|uniref:hypothetical protein n=1 Tax=Desulfobulbus sp. TaxID=895 RepID=UPI0028434BD5|nr:hypothetical protein [Desulfobulbus sp.]MDR2549611.1 hypothetical protein [Desulfobulbus sp.]
METSAFQSLKLAVVSATGLSKDALHVYVGLAVFLATSVALRKPLRSAVPWLAAIAVALAGEALDMRDDIASFGHWRWAASMHDILNTLFWPTVLLLLAKFGVLRNAK